MDAHTHSVCLKKVFADKLDKVSRRITAVHRETEDSDDAEQIICAIQLEHLYSVYFWGEE